MDFISVQEAAAKWDFATANTETLRGKSYSRCSAI